MSVRNLDKLFKPRSVALIGATDRAGSVGAVLLRNLRESGLKAPLALVNPHHAELQGMPVYPDVASLPEAPDLAVIATPPEVVPPIIAALGARGTRGAVVITATFGELGPRGEELRRAALAAARPHLLRIIGPDCVGIGVPALGLNASFSHLVPPAGDLAFVSQSGAMITPVLDWAAPRGIGFSYVVSLGDMIDVDFGDMLDYLATDPQTRAILLYAEAVTHARKFMSAARAAARAKPVVVVKVERSGEEARAAMENAAYDAAFRRAGMLRVDSMAELFSAVETLALTRAQYGDRLAILTDDSGLGLIAADALKALGGRLATLSAQTIARLDQVLPRRWSRSNPVDLTGDAPGQRYCAALDILFDEPGLDAVLAINAPTALSRPSEVAQAVAEWFAAQPPSRLLGRNLLTAWLGERSVHAARRRFMRARIPTYETTESAVRGFMHRVLYRRHQELLMETPAAQPDSFEPDAARVRGILARALAAGERWLAPNDTAAVLAAYGIPQARSRFVADAEQAAAAAAEIGFPVALKLHATGDAAAPMTDAALNLGTPERVRAEAARLLARRRDTTVRGLVVQEMMPRQDAFDLVLGIVDDPLFGPLIRFGEGGRAAELLQDWTLELPPLNEALARAQMARTRMWRLLQGYRDRPAADLGALAEILIRVAQLATDHAEIRELDINPLIAATSAVAVDARLRIAPAKTAPAARLAISPYPKELESEATLRDGTVITLKPVRPEDEPALQDIVNHMNPDDLRLRFFTPMKGLSHALAARLSQLDYDREMAILARRAADGLVLGVVRFAADPDNRQAEYAIAVRSDWKGHGIGRLLMSRIIEIAGRRGIGEIIGDVLHENEPMLRLARALGFTLVTHPDDPELVRVRKVLPRDRTR